MTPIRRASQTRPGSIASGSTSNGSGRRSVRRAWARGCRRTPSRTSSACAPRCPRAAVRAHKPAARRHARRGRAGARRGRRGAHAADVPQRRRTRAVRRPRRRARARRRSAGDREAVEDVEAVGGVPGLDELHVGINDLALALGLPNRFCVLLEPGRRARRTCRCGAGLRLGVGGIGRVADAGLPIAPDLIYAQYPRLGATGALMSRSFLAGRCDLAAEVRRSRERLAWWAGRPRAELDGAARSSRRRSAASPAF